MATWQVVGLSALALAAFGRFLYSLIYMLFICDTETDADQDEQTFGL